MVDLKTKLSLFSLLSKLGVTLLFLIFLPWLVERISLNQADNDLMLKREQTIGLIGEIGIEPFISSDTINEFGSYNILKEEFISLEKTDTVPDLNYINVSDRLIDNEKITYRVLNYTLIIDGQKYLLEIGKSLASIKNARKNITSIILLFMVLIIMITLATDIQFTRAVLKPLYRITEKLKGISVPATFDKTPIKTNTLDFVNLDKVLTDLMAQINESFRKEKEITVNISHELLTPVSVIRSKLENILLSDKVYPETAGRIEESLKTLLRLQGLVNSLLLIARIESKQYLMEDSFSAKELLDDIIGELYPISEDKGVGLIKENIDDFLVVKANRSLIFSMFYNVINNGVKNTPQEGKVTVKGYPVKNGFRVIITDTGRGMSNDQLNDLFSRFRGGRRNNEDGTGIGLAIAKSIADLHGIQISVVSELEGGTEFSFFFLGNS